jgi:2-methylisocitrate lyase-like PEP mutase family enzyme
MYIESDLSYSDAIASRLLLRAVDTAHHHWPVSVMLEQTNRLRKQLAARSAILVPGAGNALAARVIADLGFEAIYLSGAGLTNTLLGLPDPAFVSLAELVQNTAAISEVVDLPLIVDADTGFGNAINVRQTVRALERAGADVIQLEDQRSPKKCGHFSGKAVVDVDEMCGKVKAAVEGRRSQDTLVMVRTDARAVEGFDAAVARAKHYQAAGADILFVEAPESVEELAALPRLITAPLLLNIVVGGMTPIVGREELAQMGYALVLYANVALQAAITGMQNALRELQNKGQIEESGPVVSFKERQRLVGKPTFDELDRRYRSTGSATATAQA